MANAFVTQPLPNRLRVLRAERRMTQWDAAKAAGLSNSRYWLIEAGRTTARPEERQALAAVFGVSVRKVFPPAPKAVAEVA